MKHFGIYRKLILIVSTATAAVSVGMFFFMEDSFFRMLFVVSAFVLLCGLLFLLDFLHNRYNDNLLEEITLLIEALVEQQGRTVFSEAEDTLTARLQHQLLKLRNILKAQNQMLTQEKEQIKTLISDISHQIKTPVAAANTFAQLLGDTELEIKLTRTEFAILKLLMQNPVQVVSKSQLLDRISEDTPDCTESSLKTHISNLRKKLRKVSGKEYIEAVWGIGFKMKTE